MYIQFFRKVGKRKAVLKADKSSSQKKQINAKKDPNKPKRPPSAFFVFLSVSFSVAFSLHFTWVFWRMDFQTQSDKSHVNVTVRSSGKTSRKSTLMSKLCQL